MCWRICSTLWFNADFCQTLETLDLCHDCINKAKTLRIRLLQEYNFYVVAETTTDLIRIFLSRNDNSSITDHNIDLHHHLDGPQPMTHTHHQGYTIGQALSYTSSGQIVHCYAIVSTNIFYMQCFNHQYRNQGHQLELLQSKLSRPSQVEKSKNRREIFA